MDSSSSLAMVMRETLNARAVSLGLAEHVRFLGIAAHEELPGYQNSADAYVSTSLVDAGIAASTARPRPADCPPW